MFDVVDADDRVIAQRPRREVHALGLRHRAVHVLAVNRAGRIFLQRRSRAKDSFPGRWDSSASGHVGAGEDYDGTAVRELAEELGWTAATAPVPLFKLGARAETGQEFVWVYRIEAEGPFTLQAEEIDGGDWFTAAEIDAWIRERPHELAPALAHLWPLARGHLTAAAGSG